MTQKLTILGCGSSGGVPRIGSMWGACDPENAKNRRLRCSVLVEKYDTEKGATRILVDTPPDLRAQLLATGTRAIDAVLFTHDHADHTHGIDDLRLVAYAMKKRINCYFDANTRDSLVQRFGYCFEQKPNSGYPPILIANTIEPGTSWDLSASGGAVRVTAIGQCHGPISSLGFRFGSLAYSPDVSDLDDPALAQLQGLDVWIVDALRQQPHPSHFHLKKTLQWIERVKPKRAILTHMTGDMDYDSLRRELPAGVEPAFDGMTIDF